MVSRLDQIISEAIADFEEHGFDDEQRLDDWIRKIREAISFSWSYSDQAKFRDHMRATFDRLISGGVLKAHPGVETFTLAHLSSHLHPELERRIMVAAKLIKLNREAAIEKTVQRFSGWASSIPKGGSDNIFKRDVKKELTKPISRLPFIERRVLIDQGHKLNASISAVIASDSGAIAASWFSHYRQNGYNYREDHRDRDGHIYLIRNSWAHKAGFVRVGEAGYSDEITQPGEEVFCRCKFVYIYALKNLSADMVTAKGREALKNARAA